VHGVIVVEGRGLAVLISGALYILQTLDPHCDGKQVA